MEEEEGREIVKWRKEQRREEDEMTGVEGKKEEMLKKMDRKW